MRVRSRSRGRLEREGEERRMLMSNVDFPDSPAPNNKILISWSIYFLSFFKAKSISLLLCFSSTETWPPPAQFPIFFCVYPLPTKTKSNQNNPQLSTKSKKKHSPKAVSAPLPLFPLNGETVPLVVGKRVCGVGSGLGLIKDRSAPTRERASTKTPIFLSLSHSIYEIRDLFWE